MASIPLDKAEILAIFLETFLYGIYCTLFCISLYVLLTRANGTVNRPLVLASIVMMILATGHVVLDFVRIVEAFITRRDKIHGGPIGYYAEISNPLHVTKTALYVSQTLVGDALVTWRCFVIHGRKRLVIVLPIMLLVACAVTGYVVTWYLSAASPGVIFGVASSWVASFFVMTLCTNIYCTSTIVWRIWSTNKMVGAYRQYSLTPVLLAVVESGALYSSALLALLITYLAGSNGQYVALDVVTPLVGIVFSLIIIQISVYTAVRSNNANTSRGAAAAQWKSAAAPRRTCQPVSAYPLQAVAVEITHTTDADPDGDGFSQTPTVMGEPKVYRKDIWDTA